MYDSQSLQGDTKKWQNFPIAHILKCLTNFYDFS